MNLTPVTPTTSPYDISTQVTEFKRAYKGEDVRDGIINLANKLNNELNDMTEHEFVSVDDTLTLVGAGADAWRTGYVLSQKANNEYLEVSDRAAIGPDCSAALYSAAMGIGTDASSSNGQLAIGQYNEPDSNSDYLFLVGNGNADDDRNTCAAITAGGRAWFQNGVSVGGADADHGSDLATKTYAQGVVTDYDGVIKSWVTSQGYATTSAMNTALNGKVNTSDVSDDITTDAASTTKVPCVKAIKDYVSGKYVPKKIQIEYEKQSAISGTKYSNLILHDSSEEGIQAYNYESSSPLAPDSLIKAAGRGNSINLILGTDVYDNLTVHPQYDSDLVGYLYTYNAESLEGSSLQWKKVDDSKEIILVYIGVSNKHVEIISSKSYNTIDWSIVREVKYVTEDELYDAIDEALAGNN